MGSNVGIILEKSSEFVVEVSLKFEFLTTNNKAEYEFVIIGITLSGGNGGQMHQDANIISIGCFLDKRRRPRKRFFSPVIPESGC